MAKSFLFNLANCIYKDLEFRTVPPNLLEEAFQDAVDSLPSGSLQKELRGNFDRHLRRLKKRLYKLFDTKVWGSLGEPSDTGSLQELSSLENRKDVVEVGHTDTKLVYNLLVPNPVAPDDELMKDYSIDKKQKMYAFYLRQALSRDDISETKLKSVLEKFEDLITKSPSEDKSKFDWLPVMRHLVNITIESRVPAVIRILNILFQKVEKDVNNCLRKCKQVRAGRLAEVLRQFLTCFHMRIKREKLEKKETQKYVKLMSALLSIYVDLCCLYSNKLENKKALGRSVCGFVHYLLQPWPETVCEVVLQLSMLLDKHTEVLLPLISKTMSIKPETHIHYLEYVLVVRMVKDKWPQLEQVIEWAILTKNLPFSQGFIDWLQELAPQCMKRVALEKRRFKVAKYLLDQADDSLIELLHQKLQSPDTADIGTDIDVGGQHPGSPAVTKATKDLFYLDTEGLSSIVVPDPEQVEIDNQPSTSHETVILNTIEDLEHLMDNQVDEGDTLTKSYKLDPALVDEKFIDPDTKKFLESEIVSISLVNQKDLKPITEDARALEEKNAAENKVCETKSKRPHHEKRKGPNKQGNIFTSETESDNSLLEKSEQDKKIKSVVYKVTPEKEQNSEDKLTENGIDKAETVFDLTGYSETEQSIASSTSAFVKEIDSTINIEDSDIDEIDKESVQKSQPELHAQSINKLDYNTDNSDINMSGKQKNKRQPTSEDVSVSDSIATSSVISVTSSDVESESSSVECLNSTYEVTDMDNTAKYIGDSCVESPENKKIYDSDSSLVSSNDGDKSEETLNSPKKSPRKKSKSESSEQDDNLFKKTRSKTSLTESSDKDVNSSRKTPRKTSLTESSELSDKDVSSPRKTPRKISLSESSKLSDRNVSSPRKTPRKTSLSESSKLSDRHVSSPRKTPRKTSLSESSKLSDQDVSSPRKTPRKTSLSESSKLSDKDVSSPRKTPRKTSLSESSKLSDKDVSSPRKTPRKTSLSESSKLPDNDASSPRKIPRKTSLSESSMLSDQDVSSPGKTPRKTSLSESSKLSDKDVSSPKVSPRKTSLSESSKLSDNDVSSPRKSPRKTSLSESSKLSDQDVSSPRKTPRKTSLSESSKLSDKDVSSPRKTPRKTSLSESSKLSDKDNNLPRKKSSDVCNILDEDDNLQQKASPECNTTSNTSKNHENPQLPKKTGSKSELNHESSDEEVFVESQTNNYAMKDSKTDSITSKCIEEKFIVKACKAKTPIKKMQEVKKSGAEESKILSSVNKGVEGELGSYDNSGVQEITSEMDNVLAARTKSTEEIMGIIEEVKQKIKTPKKKSKKEKDESILFTDDSIESANSEQDETVGKSKPLKKNSSSSEENDKQVKHSTRKKLTRKSAGDNLFNNPDADDVDLFAAELQEAQNENYKAVGKLRTPRKKNHESEEKDKSTKDTTSERTPRGKQSISNHTDIDIFATDLQDTENKITKEAETVSKSKTPEPKKFSAEESDKPMKENRMKITGTTKRICNKDHDTDSDTDDNNRNNSKTLSTPGAKKITPKRKSSEENCNSVKSSEKKRNTRKLSETGTENNLDSERTKTDKHTPKTLLDIENGDSDDFVDEKKKKIPSKKSNFLVEMSDESASELKVEIDKTPKSNKKQQEKRRPSLEFITSPLKSSSKPQTPLSGTKTLKTPVSNRKLKSLRKRSENKTEREIVIPSSQKKSGTKELQLNSPEFEQMKLYIQTSESENEKVDIPNIGKHLKTTYDDKKDVTETLSVPDSDVPDIDKISKSPHLPLASDSKTTIKNDTATKVTKKSTPTKSKRRSLRPRSAVDVVQEPIDTDSDFIGPTQTKRLRSAVKVKPSEATEPKPVVKKGVGMKKDLAKVYEFHDETTDQSENETKSTRKSFGGRTTRTIKEKDTKKDVKVSTPEPKTPQMKPKERKMSASTSKKFVKKVAELRMGRKRRLSGELTASDKETIVTGDSTDSEVSFPKMKKAQPLAVTKLQTKVSKRLSAPPAPADPDPDTSGTSRRYSLRKK